MEIKYTKEQILAAGHEDTEHAWHQERQRADALDAELTRLRAENAALSLERRVSDSEMVALLKRVNQEFLDRAEAAEEVLRSLASYLSVGGYNAPMMRADMFERKIRDGIDLLLRPSQAENERLRDEWKRLKQVLVGTIRALAEAKAEVERLREALRPVRLWLEGNDAWEADLDGMDHYGVAFAVLERCEAALPPATAEGEMPVSPERQQQIRKDVETALGGPISDDEDF